MEQGIEVYFEELGKSIPVTVRFWDTLLHDGSIVCIRKRWICV